MAITVDATVSGTSSNSYITVSRSNVLAEWFPHMGGWLTDSTINKAQLVTHATRLLDRYFIPSNSEGIYSLNLYAAYSVPPDTNKVVAGQALWWPQKNFYYSDTTDPIPTNIIPLFVEMATIEWAWALYENPDAYDDIVPGVQSIRTPSYSMELTGARQKLIPRAVSDLMAPYATRKSRSFIRTVRV